MELYGLEDIARPLYCGPAVISAFTGRNPHEETRAAINEVRGYEASRAVKGMTDEELIAALRLLGVTCGAAHVAQFETLSDFVKIRPEFVGIVSVTGHFVAVSNGLCLDNSSRYARPVSLFRGKRKVVWTFIPILTEGSSESWD